MRLEPAALVNQRDALKDPLHQQRPDGAPV
jgi:hypothetical protein